MFILKVGFRTLLMSQTGTALQRQTAVTAYLKSKQLLLFVFASTTSYDPPVHLSPDQWCPRVARSHLQGGDRPRLTLEQALIGALDPLCSPYCNQAVKLAEHKATDQSADAPPPFCVANQM